MGRGVAAVLAAVLAVVGAGLLFVYVSGADERALAGLDPRDVLVITEPVPAGTRAGELAAFTELRSLPNDAVAQGSLADLGDLDPEHVANTTLTPGEQVLPSRFVSPDSTELTVAVPFPDEAQLLSIQLSPERVVGGRLKAGDTVGVYLSRDVEYEDEAGETARFQETHALTHQVLVVRVQGASVATSAAPEGETEQTPSNDVIVTLAVTAELAERIIHGQEFGLLWLTHERATSDLSGTRIVDATNIFEP